jgi:hypothetical protein
LKAEREASAKAYGDFIQAEGEKIAGLIDQGHTLEEIDELIDRGHSGNTYGWALHLGIKNATNRESAEAVRVAHNAKYGVSADKSGTVNPALLTIGVREDADIPTPGGEEKREDRSPRESPLDRDPT